MEATAKLATNFLLFIHSQLTRRWHPQLFAESSPASALLEQSSHDLVRNFQNVTRRYEEQLRIAFGCVSPRLSWNDIVTAAVQHIHEVNLHGATMISMNEPSYPKHLKHISRPPLFVTFFGDNKTLQRDAVAIVGARKATPEARRLSYDWGHFLARSGCTVVSGGAFGCDIEAHQGVLDAKIEPAPAIVVLAGGLEQLYPLGNSKTFTALREKGAVLLSERLWWQTPQKCDFPIRNRIIAGIAWHTFLIQAAEQSGALVTAKLALDYGREVYVACRSVDDICFRGNDQLLRDGANILLHPETGNITEMFQRMRSARAVDLNL